MRISLKHAVTSRPSSAVYYLLLFREQLFPKTESQSRDHRSVPLPRVEQSSFHFLTSWMLLFTHLHSHSRTLLASRRTSSLPGLQSLRFSSTVHDQHPTPGSSISSHGGVSQVNAALLKDQAGADFPATSNF